MHTDYRESRSNLPYRLTKPTWILPQLRISPTGAQHVLAVLNAGMAIKDSTASRLRIRDSGAIEHEAGIGKLSSLLKVGALL